MRILHLITALETGGAETMLAKLLSAMDGCVYEPLVVSMVRPGELGRRISETGVEVRDLGMRRGLPSPRGLQKLISCLNHWQPDVVQTWLYHADLLGLAAVRLGFPLGWRPALAWNLRCSFMDFSRYRRSTVWTVRLCARLSGLPEAVVANSRSAVQQHAALGYRPRRVEVIPNGFDAGLFRPRTGAAARLRQELGAPGETLLVGMVARFDPMKDHQTFLQAAGIVARRNPKAHFVCCGSGADAGNPDLARWADQAGLGKRLHLLGQRENVELDMAGLDCCVSASRGESFPNVLGEALSCGVPCVATDVGDSAAIVGDAGERVPPGDALALAEAMLRVLALPAEARARLGHEGRMRMIRDYSLQSVAEQYARFYDSLVRPSSGASAAKIC